MSALRFVLSGRSSLPPQYQVNFYERTEEPIALAQVRDMPTLMLESLTDRVAKVSNGHRKVDQCFSFKTSNLEVKRETLAFCKRVQSISTWGGRILFISNFAGWFFLWAHKTSSPAKKWMVGVSLVSGLLLYRGYGSWKFAKSKESDIQSISLVEEADDFANQRKANYPQAYLGINPYNYYVHSAEILYFFLREFDGLIKMPARTPLEQAKYVGKFLEMGRSLLKEEIIHVRMAERERVLGICKKFKQFEEFVLKKSDEWRALLKFREPYRVILGLREDPFNVPMPSDNYGPTLKFDEHQAYQDTALEALIDMLPAFMQVRHARLLAQKFDVFFYPIVRDFIEALFDNKKPVPETFKIEISEEFGGFQAPAIPTWDGTIPANFYEHAQTYEPPAGTREKYSRFVNNIPKKITKKTA